jgi:hypothetical protein
LHFLHIRRAIFTLVESGGQAHILNVTSEVAHLKDNGRKAMKFLKLFRRRGYAWQPALNAQNGASAADLMIFVGN